MKELLGNDLSVLLERSSLAAFPKLADLVGEIQFLQDRGMVRVRDSYSANDQPVDDPTGIECLNNRWHIEDLVPDDYQTPRGLAEAGIAFAIALLEKAKPAVMNDVLRAIVSVQEKSDDNPFQSCTVRLHILRPENPWLADDLDGYREEALLVIDK